MSAVTSVPHSVARGMLRFGSMTLSAGTVADSSPSSAHSVSVADAVIAEIVNGCGSTLITDASCAAEQDEREHDDREQRHHLQHRRDELERRPPASRRAS